MKRIIKKNAIYFILCMLVALSLSGCGKKENKKDNSIGNGGNQVNVDSADKLGGEEATEDEIKESEKVGKERPDEITISIDWDKIIVDKTECKSVEEMKDAIIDSGCKSIVLNHENASKKTLDEVKEALGTIEDSLDMSVNYN